MCAVTYSSVLQQIIHHAQHLLTPCCLCAAIYLRLVASKQEEHQSSKAQSAESARLGVLRHQRQTATSMSQAHAAQPGPGEHRAEGPRSFLDLDSFLFLLWLSGKKNIQSSISFKPVCMLCHSMVLSQRSSGRILNIPLQLLYNSMPQHLHHKQATARSQSMRCNLCHGVLQLCWIKAVSTLCNMDTGPPSLM